MNLQNGLTYKYVITAFDFMRNESQYSNAVSIQAGDNIPPAAPLWGEPPYETGGSESGVWAELFYQKSPEPDVARYIAYTR